MLIHLPVLLAVAPSNEREAAEGAKQSFEPWRAAVADLLALSFGPLPDREKRNVQGALP